MNIRVRANLLEKTVIIDGKKQEVYGLADFYTKQTRIGTYEERDFFWRAQRVGFRTYWTTHSYVHHYGHMTFKSENIDVDEVHDKNRVIFDERKKNDPNLFIENDVEV